MKKVLLSVCMAIAAMSVSAQNLTVLSEKTLPMGNKMQVVKDAQGRIFRKLVKPEGYKAAATAPVKAAASDDIVTFYEGFETIVPTLVWIGYLSTGLRLIPLRMFLLMISLHIILI